METSLCHSLFPLQSWSSGIIHVIAKLELVSMIFALYRIDAAAIRNKELSFQ